MFSVKSHKADNLVARIQVPFCSYFSGVISSCLVSVNEFDAAYSRANARLTIGSSILSHGFRWGSCPLHTGVRGRQPPKCLLAQAAGAAGAAGAGLAGSGGAGWARWPRLILQLGSALACWPRLDPALEIEMYLKGNSGSELYNLWKQGNAVGQSYNSLSPLAWRALLVFTARLRFYWKHDVSHKQMQNTQLISVLSANLVYITYFSTFTDC